MKIIFFILIILTSLHLFAADDELEKLYSCYLKRDIKVSDEYDKIQWEPRDPFTKVCVLSFRVTSKGIRRTYITRRWRSPAYCKKFMKDWKSLKKDDQKVCIAGYLSYPEVKKDKGILEESGYWEVIKSERWCHTYFMGNCRGTPSSTESF